MKLINQFKQGKLIYINLMTNLAVYESSHYRWLTLNDTCQSIILKRQPTKLVLPHHYALMLPLLFFIPKQVVILGLGGGNLNRFLFESNPDLNLTIIEQSPDIVDIYRAFFSPTPTNETIIIRDAIDWLSQEYLPEINWLICDIFSKLEERQTLEKIISLVICKQHQQIFSINIAGARSEEINRLLYALKTKCREGDIAYFNVPHYNNVVVHVMPAQLMNKPSFSSSMLTQAIHRRWQSLWQHRRLI